MSVLPEKSRYFCSWGGCSPPRSPGSYAYGFSSYLSGRKQVVRIENAISDQLELRFERFGVPQGSILGPVLFHLYVNELLSIPNHCQSMGYVDDTKLLLALPPNQTTDAVSMLNDDLREITKWCCRNSLLLNPDKTKLLVIGVPQLTKTLPPLSVTLMGKIHSKGPWSLHRQ